MTPANVIRFPSERVRHRCDACRQPKLAKPGTCADCKSWQLRLDAADQRGVLRQRGYGCARCQAFVEQPGLCRACETARLSEALHAKRAMAERSEREQALPRAMSVGERVRAVLGRLVTR